MPTWDDRSAAREISLRLKGQAVCQQKSKEPVTAAEVAAYRAMGRQTRDWWSQGSEEAQRQFEALVAAAEAGATLDDLGDEGEGWTP